jgi:hypothetical protein
MSDTNHKVIGESAFLDWLANKWHGVAVHAQNNHAHVDQDSYLENQASRAAASMSNSAAHAERGISSLGARIASVEPLAPLNTCAKVLGGDG